MSVLNKLSYSLGDKTQTPNKELARKISDVEDIEAIAELEEIVTLGEARRLKMDAIMTLAYVAELNAPLMSEKVDFFMENLAHPIERLGWGSMIGLWHITSLNPHKVFDSLSKVLDGMERDSIVGRDYGFKILVTLYGEETLEEDVFYLMLEQIRKVKPNQLGQYTERLMRVLNKLHLNALIETLEERRSDVTNEYHVRRLNKNLKKLYKQL